MWKSLIAFFLGLFGRKIDTDSPKEQKVLKDLEGTYKNYRLHDDKGRRLAIFADKKDGKVIFTVYACSRLDSFNKKAAYRAYVNGTNIIEEEIVGFVKEPAEDIQGTDGKMYPTTKKRKIIKGIKKTECTPRTFEGVKEDGKTPIDYNIFELTDYITKLFYVKSSIVKIVKHIVYYNSQKGKILIEKPNGKIGTYIRSNVLK